MLHPLDLTNPFDYLAGQAGKAVADGWTAAMVAVWRGGLWVLRLVLQLVDAFTTPDLSADGPAALVYRTTFWLAGTLMLALLLVQLGVAAIRRDGKSLATALLGCGKFVVVWAGWVGYGVAVVAACGGLTTAVMRSVLKVDSWSAWQPWVRLGVDDVTDAAVATVLGLMGLLLWLAAVGHLLVMLTRAGGLLVLAAMTPVAAAGLVADAGRSWFWKSLRWFHAAAFTPVLMVFMLGIGVQVTTGVATGLTNTTEQAVGTALPGVVLILVACFSPLALFKLLAFVDPATPSGAAFRTGLAAVGGLQGLLAGGSPANASSGTSDGRASGDGVEAVTGGGGKSQGENAADQATAGRFATGSAQLSPGPPGQAAATAAQALGQLQDLGSRAATVGSDLSNQMGVGHATLTPDTATSEPSRDSPGEPVGEGHSGGDGAADTSRPGNPEPSTSVPAEPPPDQSSSPHLPPAADAATPAPPSSAVPPPSAGPRPGGSASGAGEGGGGGAASVSAGGAAETAAAVPIIPV